MRPPGSESTLERSSRPASDPFRIGAAKETEDVMTQPQTQAPALAVPPTLAASKTAIRTFKVESVSEAQLADLRRRIEATRFPDRETVADATQGVQLTTMQRLARYWSTEYEWRKCESRLQA